MPTTQIRKSPVNADATLPKTLELTTETFAELVVSGVLGMEQRLGKSGGEIVLFLIGESIRRGDSTACVIAALVFERLARDDDDKDQAAEYLKKAETLGISPEEIGNARKMLAAYSPVKIFEEQNRPVASNSEIIIELKAAYEKSLLCKLPSTMHMFKCLVTIEEPLANLGYEEIRLYQERFGGVEGPWIYLGYFLEQYKLTASLEVAKKALHDKLPKKTKKAGSRLARKINLAEEAFINGNDDPL